MFSAKVPGRELASGLLPDVVDFDKSHTACAVLSVENGRVISLRQCLQNRGLPIVAGSYARALDKCLLCVPPIIILRNDGAVGIVNFQHWILERVENTQEAMFSNISLFFLH